MKLEWHPINASPMDWDEAVKYCEGLGNGWRLPTVQELFSIVNYNKFHPASDLDMKSAGYWSSTTYAGNSGGAWIVHFDDGNIYGGYESGSLYVRAVREVPDINNQIDMAKDFLVAALAKALLKEHEELKKFTAGFGQARACECETCTKARRLVELLKE